MLSFVGEINPIKDILLPILIGFLTAFAYSRSGRLFKVRRKNLARRKIEDDLKISLSVLSASYGGGFNTLLTLKVTHLIVRCAAFLWSFVGVMGFFILAETKADVGYTYQTIGLGIATGIFGNLVRTAWDDIHEISLAYADPVTFTHKIQERSEAIGATEFQERINRAKQLAHDVDLERRGRMSAGILIGRFIFEKADEDPNTEASTNSDADTISAESR